MTRALLLLFAVSAAGCDDAEDRQRLNERDGLVRERQYLTTHQSNLRMAADAEIAGRPLEALPPDSAVRLAAFQMQYLEADRRLRQVDADIESLQKQPNPY
ncbi:MAG TPA: hypothetical protein VD866_11450 [Urbifossiella sp.]|nr:hypothetical protein [Urbifossiella sp.]